MFKVSSMTLYRTKKKIEQKANSILTKLLQRKMNKKIVEKKRKFILIEYTPIEEGVGGPNPGREVMEFKEVFGEADRIIVVMELEALLLK